MSQWSSRALRKTARAHTQGTRAIRSGDEDEEFEVRGHRVFLALAAVTSTQVQGGAYDDPYTPIYSAYPAISPCASGQCASNGVPAYSSVPSYSYPADSQAISYGPGRISSRPNELSGDLSGGQRLFRNRNDLSGRVPKWSLRLVRSRRLFCQRRLSAGRLLPPTGGAGTCRTACAARETIPGELPERPVQAGPDRDLGPADNGPAYDRPAYSGPSARVFRRRTTRAKLHVSSLRAGRARRQAEATQVRAGRTGEPGPTIARFGTGSWESPFYN